MVPGEYVARVIVDGNFVPAYQYVNGMDSAVVRVGPDSTPLITALSPFKGVPGTFVTLNGDFKTACYLRDTPECADDTGSRIVRVYVGGQQCEMIDPATSEL